MKNRKAYPGCLWHSNFCLSIKMAIWVNDDKSVLQIKAQSYPMSGVTIIALLTLIAVYNINPVSEGAFCNFQPFRGNVRCISVWLTNSQPFHKSNNRVLITLATLVPQCQYVYEWLSLCPKKGFHGWQIRGKGASASKPVQCRWLLSTLKDTRKVSCLYLLHERTI